MMTIQQESPTKTEWLRLVAYHHDEAVGYATLQTNDYHPTIPILQLSVEPQWRRRRIATQLLAQLQQLHPSSLRCATMSDNLPLCSFLVSQGFVLKRRTYECCVTSQHLTNAENITPITCHSLQDAPSAVLARVQQQLYEDYKNKHAPISPLNDTTLSPQDWIATLCEDWQLEHSYYVQEGPHIGYAIAFNATDSSIELGYLGGTLSDDTFGAMTRQLAHRYTALFDEVWCEVDDGDRHMMMWLSHFDLPLPPSYDLYVRP